MSSRKAPSLILLREILEYIRDNIAPERRHRWQRLVDLLKRGTLRYETLISDLESEIYMLESSYFQADGVDWQDVLLRDIESMRDHPPQPSEEEEENSETED